MKKISIPSIEKKTKIVQFFGKEQMKHKISKKVLQIHMLN